MPRLPTLRRRRSKTDQALDAVKQAARVWTLVKVGSVASSTAKGGTKAYGTAKTAKVAGRPVAKLLVVPAAAAGGFLIWRRFSSSRSEDDLASDQGRPLGPVATPEAVSPPAPEPESGALTDPPAGASNPPVTPQPAAADDDEGSEPPVGPSPTFADDAT